MQLRRYRGVILGLLGWALAAYVCACAGGSGSSGFDALPEGAAIQQALEQQECVTRRGLMICPAEEASGVVPSGTPPVAAVPTPTPSPQRPHPPHSPVINTGIHDAMPVACFDVGTNLGCLVSVPFTAEGFAVGTEFHVAVRTLEPPGPWIISASPAPNEGPSAPSFDGTVSVAAPVRAPTVRVQVAILAFEAPPTAVPSEVEELADSGADAAYVTGELTLQPSVP